MAAETSARFGCVTWPNRDSPAMRLFMKILGLKQDWISERIGLVQSAQLRSTGLVVWLISTWTKLKHQFAFDYAHRWLTDLIIWLIGIHPAESKIFILKFSFYRLSIVRIFFVVFQPISCTEIFKTRTEFNWRVLSQPLTFLFTIQLMPCVDYLACDSIDILFMRPFASLNWSHSMTFFNRSVGFS